MGSEGDGGDGGTGRHDRGSADRMLDRMVEQLQQSVDPVQLVQRLAEQSLDFVENAQGVLVGMAQGDDGHRTVLFFCGAGMYQPWVGMQVHVDTSLSGACMKENAVLVAHDTEHDPRVDLDACRRTGARSIVCIPIHRDGVSIGMVNVGSQRAHSFSDRDVEILTGIVDFMSSAVLASAELTQGARRLVERAAGGGMEVGTSDKVEAFVADVLSPVAANVRRGRSHIRSVIEERRVQMYFQPMVSLADGRIVGVEALARFWEDPYRPPDHWFALAEAVGFGLDLEMLAVELALEHLSDLAPDLHLAVNASPATVLSPRLLQAVRAVRWPERIVVEVTEHTGVADYDALTAAEDRLRDAGAALAVDDTGSGVSSLSHILHLRPDYIKLDRFLVTGIDHDPARRALASSLAAFAAEIDARIVAEGIESRAELEALRGLGVDMGQGFFLHLPRPLAELPPEALAGS